MKKSATLVVLFILSIIILMVVFSSFFIVNEIEQVVVTRFGKPIGIPIQKAGIHFKIPIVDKANFFDKRKLEWNGSPDEIPTKDKNIITVLTTARWRITNPLIFMQDLGVSEEAAHQRLDGIIDSIIRDEISGINLAEIVRNSNRIIKAMEDVPSEFGDTEGQSVEEIHIGRDKITRDMVDKAKQDIAKLGIELIDVRITGLMYERSVQEKIFSRMISEQKKIAAKIRSQGQAEKERIEGRMNLDLKTIDSEGYREAQEIKGDADAQSAKIYAESYNVAPDLYQFMASLDAYEQAIDSNSVIILGSDAEFFQALKSSKKRSE